MLVLTSHCTMCLNFNVSQFRAMVVPKKIQEEKIGFEIPSSYFKSTKLSSCMFARLFSCMHYMSGVDYLAQEILEKNVSYLWCRWKINKLSMCNHKLSMCIIKESLWWLLLCDHFFSWILWSNLFSDPQTYWTVNNVPLFLKCLCHL